LCYPLKLLARSGLLAGDSGLFEQHCHPAPCMVHPCFDGVCGDTNDLGNPSLQPRCYRQWK
jgi:hypothetical protein